MKVGLEEERHLICVTKNRPESIILSELRFNIEPTHLIKCIKKISSLFIKRRKNTFQII